MTERLTKNTLEKLNVWVRHRVFILAARLLLGGIFVFASIDKILHPAAFADAVYNYQILPDSLINLTAVFLPWLELILGGCLIAGVWLPGAAEGSEKTFTLRPMIRRTRSSRCRFSDLSKSLRTLDRSGQGCTVFWVMPYGQR